MKKVKAIILRTAGTNCDRETAEAFRMAGAEADLVHVNSLKRERGLLDKYHIMAIPGGFTYGDDIASGKVLANELKSTLKAQVTRFVKRGKPVIGICNGFQVLVKMGILPDLKGKLDYSIEATLSLNDSGKFEDRWVHLRKEKASSCIWTEGLPDIIYVPVAHAEGKFMPGDGRVLKKLNDNGQIVFRYSGGAGSAPSYPENPNGSVQDIAGICDTSGRILGLMPHPERHVTYLQHPNWRRIGAKGRSPEMGVGLRMFKNGVKSARNHI